MWTQLTVEDRSKVDRYCEQLQRINTSRIPVPLVRSMLKRSGYKFYLFDDGVTTITIALGKEPRSGRYLIKHFSCTENLTPAVAKSLLVVKLLEYGTLHRVNTFYANVSNGIGSQGREAIRLLSETVGVVVTQTPRPPDFFELRIELTSIIGSS